MPDPSEPSRETASSPFTVHVCIPTSSFAHCCPHQCERTADSGVSGAAAAVSHSIVNPMIAESSPAIRVIVASAFGYPIEIFSSDAGS